MNVKLSIACATACLVVLAGCSSSADPLQGKWQGTVEVSGKLSLDDLMALSTEKADEADGPPRTEVAVLTLEFLGANQLRLKTEPMPSKSPFGPDEQTASYEVVEALPGEYRLMLDVKGKPYTLQFRFSDQENMTLTQEAGSPHLLPISMTRMDSA
ncbi:hypothetical protein DTL42_22120 [Bremerella cremea]|uniref:Lipocalin-like domain-containing protein n=1 Tax=Bremerella cremea TaxID=1031537 RepID=A0A368KKG7_9BACT|nr:hypothetical protein [Bremerella cremea]RCS41266.1 hypothetical protein DTL42_22120 [Bremerella cremea]